jgi:hypothetical protein
MKTILNCSIAALLGTVLAIAITRYGYAGDKGTRATADNNLTDIPAVFRTDTPEMLAIAGGVNAAPWLEIRRADKNAADKTKGFDPCYTYVLSDYKPIIKKLRDGRWEIQFTAEIAENLP